MYAISKYSVVWSTEVPITYTLVSSDELSLPGAMITVSVLSSYGTHFTDSGVRDASTYVSPGHEHIVGSTSDANSLRHVAGQTVPSTGSPGHSEFMLVFDVTGAGQESVTAKLCDTVVSSASLSVFDSGTFAQHSQAVAYYTGSLSDIGATSPTQSD